MKKVPFAGLILALVIALSACNDPIFYMISKETPKLKPRIGGSPTNFVVFNNSMYVASGENIWDYKNGSWTRHPQDKWIGQLAANTTLYALCDDGSVKSFDSSMVETSTSINNAKSIFVANGTLFYENKADGSISSYNGSTSTPISFSGSTLIADLRGVAYGSSTTYLCTHKDGIFSVSGSVATLITGSSSKEFMGIITLQDNNTVVAITRDGVLYKVDTGIGDPIASFGSRLANGALALWTDSTDTDKNLLLAGRQDGLVYTTSSGYTYGYMELVLDASGGIVTGNNFVEPGKTSPSSVSDNERYVSTIGKNPANHIFQASDGILFASTQKEGVWSYRVRGGIPQWNAEE